MSYCSFHQGAESLLEVNYTHKYASTKNNADRGTNRSNMQTVIEGVDELFKEMLAARQSKMGNAS